VGQGGCQGVPPTGLGVQVRPGRWWGSLGVMRADHMIRWSATCRRGLASLPPSLSAPLNLYHPPNSPTPLHLSRPAPLTSTALPVPLTSTTFKITPPAPAGPSTPCPLTRCVWSS
jgi:hypothetical protein